jgi:hypothetical protein
MFIVKIIEGKKTVPMIGCFVLLITTSILNQITWSRVYLGAKMT